jgi:hypothetical protein
VPDPPADAAHVDGDICMLSFWLTQSEISAGKKQTVKGEAKPSEISEFKGMLFERIDPHRNIRELRLLASGLIIP